MTGPKCEREARISIVAAVGVCRAAFMFGWIFGAVSTALLVIVLRAVTS